MIFIAFHNLTRTKGPLLEITPSDSDSLPVLGTQKSSLLQLHDVSQAAKSVRKTFDQWPLELLLQFNLQNFFERWPISLQHNTHLIDACPTLYKSSSCEITQ